MGAVQARVKYAGAWYAAIVLLDEDVVIFADDGAVASLATDDSIEAIIPFDTWIDISCEVLGDEPAAPTDVKTVAWASV